MLIRGTLTDYAFLTAMCQHSVMSDPLLKIGQEGH